MFSIKNLTNEKKSEIKNTVLIFLLLLPHFQPSSLNFAGSKLDLIFNIGKIISGLVISIIFVVDFIKNKYINKSFFVFCILNLYIFFNSIIQSGSYKELYVKLFSAVILLMIVDYYSRNNTKELINALLIIFEILIYINFILLIISPNGLYGQYYHFLGNRNGHIAYIMIGLTLALIWKEICGKSIRFYILLAVGIISILIGGSVTGLFALCLFILLFFTKIYKLKFTTLTTGLIIYILAFIFIVFVRIQDNMGSFFALFGKDTTFSTRTAIWDKAIDMIPLKPIFGYGYLEKEIKVPIFGYSSLHSFILEHLFQGGIVEILLLVVFLISIIKQMKKTKCEYFSKYIVIGIFSILVHSLQESASGPMYFIPFILLSNSDYIQNAIVANRNDKTLPNKK